MIALAPNHSQLSESRFGRIVLALMVLGFVAVLAAGVSAAVLMARTQQRGALIVHTHDVEREVNAIRLSLERMRSGRRGTLLGLGPSMLTDFEEGTASLRRSVETVARLTLDNPRQQAAIARLRVLAPDLHTLMTRSMRPGADRSVAAEAPLQANAAEMERISQGMLAEERRLLAIRDRQQQAAARQFFIVLVIAGLLLVAVAAGSIWVIRRYTRELRASSDQLRLLNDDLEGAVRERTTDLQRANEEIQRFAYIVSHDLRSPLVNVMGFTAELEAATRTVGALIDRAEADAPGIVTDEARLAAREDLPEAIGFIRTSTQKMDRLINAILRLSREGRRTIALEPIDLADIARSVADSLHHRTDELGATIAVTKPLPRIVSDRLAVEQILSNLVENAVKYLKPGRPGLIEVRGRTEGGRAIVEVVDNGRGIDPRDHDRVFDLFRRSGVQDQPGEGIGLAHVRAQAYRIGGTIGVDSRLDEGATFRVNLPVHYTGEQGQAA